ncbi:MAG: BLUF domain-containing protein [Pseudomonadota bacterium]
MPSAPGLFELMYVSTLAPDEDPGIVAAIAAHARLANEMLGVTGLLVYDGHRFAQHLEGSEEAVTALYARIEADTRHTAVNLRHHGACGHRRYPQFSMGFSDIGNASALQELEGLSGAAALAAFAGIRNTVELLYI